ncbi:hypothetical protein D9757_002303 [Collybiopsis confluens]|uniref:Uncharacterized protein n=1 Tax=Collybiopsis confluens TaxID=2823264 RepID=A0A8H5HZS3_9AGAR|nr:hypothetical protein D9757_002303 [Collybiopsis confluens]
MYAFELRTLSASVQQVLPSRLKSAPSPAGPPVASDDGVPELVSQRAPRVPPPQTKEQILRAKAQYLVTCCCMFAIGFNDASAGPLLPRMQSAYQISFVVLSLLFIFSCVGYLLGACLNVVMSETIAFGKLLVLSCILQMVAFTLVSPALPFPVFVLGYFFNGVGSAIQVLHISSAFTRYNVQPIQLSQVNGYLVTMGSNINGKVAISQASYGAGALIAPLVATQFSVKQHWSFHYLVSLGMVTANAILSSAVFRFKSKEG